MDFLLFPAHIKEITNEPNKFLKRHSTSNIKSKIVYSSKMNALGLQKLFFVWCLYANSDLLELLVHQILLWFTVSALISFRSLQIGLVGTWNSSRIRRRTGKRRAGLILPFFVAFFGVGMEIRLMIVGFAVALF
ncbi:hypothetical protein L6452_36631 [Arctium lappa]|uniref:Uncharacterized protein n=1 Tax=Arctium lappa TaxID=4217 RepID=A0ACB8YAM4_ARCLA|nr:hypothetical protein L6452_36631 [Arctium lappa]